MNEQEAPAAPPSPKEEGLWPEINPWILLLLAGLAYYVYQNYLSNINWPKREEQITPQDEEKVRQMMEARNKQQAKYDQDAKKMEEEKKNEPPPKLGPISKQIAAKAKLRPGDLFLIGIKDCNNVKSLSAIGFYLAIYSFS